jgi:uncharacterized protein
MTTEPTAPTGPTPPPPVAVPLTPGERRVLGVLAEKQKTTPDSYPMTRNALVTGCNQKSNRDPVTNLSDDEVEEALASAQKRGLVTRLTGSGRAEKWRHNLYDVWKVDKAELAVLVELLLRGPQTEGELRGRVSRMEPIDDLDRLRAVLRPLTERKLVVYLTEQGRRGTMVTHGFHRPEELARLRSAQPPEPAPAPAPAPTAAPAPPPPPVADPPAVVALKGELTAARAEIAALRTALGALEEKVARLADQVKQVRDGLGL